MGVSEELIRRARHGDADAFTALCAPLEGMSGLLQCVDTAVFRPANR